MVTLTKDLALQILSILRDDATKQHDYARMTAYDLAIAIVSKIDGLGVDD